MLVFCLLAVLASKVYVAQGAAVSDVNDKKLLMAFAVNRHGERTPAQEEAELSPDFDKIKKIIEIEGYEGLTNEGKRRAYQIGKFLKHRYSSYNGLPNLLSKIYLKDEISVRSTFKDRTQMTAQIAMAALYHPEPEQQWDSGLGRIWQPVPYLAVNLAEDYLRYYSNCQRFKILMKQAKSESIEKEFAPYADLIPLLKEKTGANFTEDPVLFETLYDLFRSQVGLGLDIPEWAKPLMPRLSEAGRLAYRLYFRYEEMKKLGGGVILNDFVQAAYSIINGERVTKRFRLFSAHDFNIGSLMDVSRIEGSGSSIPEYGAIFALELYGSQNGQYYVLPVYVSQAGASAGKQLRITGCDDNFCEFEKFRNITAEYLLPEKKFYEICNIRTEL